MKPTAFSSVLAVLILCTAAIAPRKIKEKDIVGKWKFHLEISKSIDKETKNDNDLGSIFARGVGHMVDDLVEEVEIIFDFQKNHLLIVTQHSSFDEEEQGSVETYRWKINQQGHIITTSMKDSNQEKSIQNFEEWKLKKGKLVPVGKEEKNVVWMEKIKK
tara:strand:- start:52 stop:531 length:480 start_codon:yes stop_codon:yes gene_type:complete